MDRIVVGVDGSEHSIRALKWAIAEGAAHQATVEALISWSYPVLPADGFSGSTVTFDVAALEEGARQTLEAAITEVGPEAASVERLVVEGTPGHALIDASNRADLLVVGTRGHGGFAGLLLGSVSSQCAHHARCPIVVVPPPDQH
jgi:nucleotide-binding universal stress UspA family protein